ncbi:MAG TPA: hypothetical protein VKV40_25455 [Ktedonobacteraceae bacterium]|nr:hypothetical protein [Ktedonobacteraceae bacterium]
MALIGMSADISALLDALAYGNMEQIISTTRDLLRQGDLAYKLAGRIGMIACHGDPDGHSILTLTAASMLSFWLYSLPRGPEYDLINREREIAILTSAFAGALPAIRAGRNTQDAYPEPFFPSDLPENKTMADMMHDAIFNNEPTMVERLLFGLYGTGADYRTMLVRIYDGISTTFQNGGHPLTFAVRGSQLLDAVEWGDRAPNYIHWLTPHLPLHTQEPEWVNIVRAFLADPAHSYASYRTRLALPKNENALPLRALITSNADATQICQGVYNALIPGGASARGIGSVISMAAADVMQKVDDGDRAAFIKAAHGLLFAAATRVVFAQVQDIEALPLLFTAAVYVNALSKELGEPKGPTHLPTALGLGGGLLAPALLDTLTQQLLERDLNGAFGTARRYLRLGHDPRALFAIIGLVASQADATLDQGHTLQIVQAAGEEFMAWPRDLASTSADGILHVALRAAAFPQRNSLAPIPLPDY